MKNIIQSNVLRVKFDITFLELVNVMLSAGSMNAEVGLVVVENNDGSMLGIITDGDVRRALSRQISYDAPIKSLIVKDPVTVKYSDSRRHSLQQLKNHEERLKSQGRWYRPEQILVLEDKGKVLGVVDKKAFLDISSDGITAVNLGLGFIGLPFTVILANAGISTCGVDVDEDLVELVKKGITRFFEPGLEDMLQTQIALKTIKFDTRIPPEGADVYFVSVGTPVTGNGEADLSYIKQAINDVARSLVGGELVVIRSTLSVGSTRKVLVPILESVSGLKAGVDFYVVFAPERVVEGKVIEEYSSLPQIIGGYTDSCLRRGIAVFSRFNSYLVDTDSLEAAELIKLANNSLRNLSFAFANELTLICDRHALDARKLIEAANEGYPRNPISFPSPGVGGMCLPKDSRLYSLSECSLLSNPELGDVARKINSAMPKYVSSKIEQWKDKVNLKWSDVRVAIFGAAFKGMPETSDLRNSPGIDLIMLLKKHGVGILTVRDCVVKEKDLHNAGFDEVWNHDLGLGEKKINCIVVMNNHISHVNLGWNTILFDLPRPALVFDSWGQVNMKTVLSHKGISYGSLGRIVYG